MYAVYYWLYTETTPVKRLIYAPNSGEDGYLITKGKFQKGINMAGSLTIVVPPTNPNWKRYWSDGTEIDYPTILGPAVLISVDLVENGIDKEIWRGRIISQSWDIYRNMTINCEGILAYLNDILLPPYNFSWTGVISHAYDPSEGLKFANLDILKDFLPTLTTDGIAAAVEGVVENVVKNEVFTPDTAEIYETIEKGLPIPNISEDGTVQEDNVDRRVSVYDYILFIMTLYNTELTQDQTDILKQIKMGYIDPIFKTDEYLVNCKTDKYTNAWEAIDTNVLEIYGGVMFLSNWYKNSEGKDVYDPYSSYLYYYKNYSEESQQVVQYGENLVNFEMESDGTEIVSRWYVFGSVKDANGKETQVDMSSVNGGLKYVGIPVSTGTISKVEYTELTTPQDCYNRGLQLLRESLFSQTTTTVNAVDMNLVDHSINPLEPGAKIRVIMDNEAYSYGDAYSEYEFRIESVDVDLLSPEDSEYVLKKISATS